MGATSTHKYGPWARAVLVPFWVIQTALLLFIIFLLALGVAVLGRVADTYGDELTGDEEHVVHVATDILGPIWIALTCSCLILTITEIVLLVRRKLTPLTFLVMSVIKTTIWTVLLIVDVVGTVDGGARAPTALGIIVEGVLWLAFVGPLIYASVIYHRFRRDEKAYKSVDLSSSAYNPGLNSQYQPPTYGQQYAPRYNQPYTPELQSLRSGDDVEAHPGRRLSYNHERDTRFDVYKHERASYVDSGSMERTLCSPTNGNAVPSVLVEHHDEGRRTFELESRSQLR